MAEVRFKKNVEMSISDAAIEYAKKILEKDNSERIESQLKNQ